MLSLLIYSDASNSSLTSVYKEKGKAKICHKSFSDKEKSPSSTWGETVRYAIFINTSKNKSENKTIFWVQTGTLVV